MQKQTDTNKGNAAKPAVKTVPGAASPSKTTVKTAAGASSPAKPSVRQPAAGSTARKAASGTSSTQKTPVKKTPSNTGVKPGVRIKTAQNGAGTDTMYSISHKLSSARRTTIQFTRKSANRFESFVNADSPDNGGKRGGISRFGMSFAKFAAICLIALALFLTYYANKTIKVNSITVTIPGISPDFEGYRILLMSDLHGRTYGENQAVLLRELEDLKYDIVLLTGDMVGASGDPEPFYKLIEGLPSSKPVYFIAGDSDPGPLLTEARDIEGTLNEMLLEDWVLGAVERGAVYLNKPVKIEVADSVMWLSPASFLNVNADSALEMSEYELSLQKDGVVSGIGVDHGTLPYTNYRYRQYTALKEAALYMEEDDLHITLSHYPLSEEVLSAAQINAPATENAYLMAPDLALAGHYCGGTWRIPLIGAFYIPDTLAPRHGWFPDQSVVSGLRASTSSNTTVYTSAGLGVTDYGLFPDIRLFNNPEVTVLTITTVLTPDLLG